MSNRTTLPQRRASPAQLTTSLQRRGLSPLGAQQALQGHVVSDPKDRAAVAQILAAAASDGLSDKLHAKWEELDTWSSYRPW